MDAEKHGRIAQRAYALWQAEGGPEGRQEENWYRAEQEIEVEEAARPAVNRIPASRPRQRRKVAKG